MGGGRNPRTIRLIVIVVALVVVISGLTVYYIVTRPPGCRLTSTNPLIFDQPEQPDTLDPQVTFTTPGWGIVQQVYQTLVMYNGSSYTKFLPVLAQSWTESSDGMNLTFTLRTGVKFSNGDPFNAYVMWYSLNRALVMNQAPQFILSENFWYPHVNYYSPSDDVNASIANLTTALNTFDFTSPTSSEITVMSDPYQSFQVINDHTIQLNLGYGYLGTAYTYILSTLAAPIAAAVDPIQIGANGGVTNSTNDWMSTNMLGTGPYNLSSYNTASGYLLQRDPGYWGGAAAAAEPWNNILQPGKSDIQINFQGDPARVTSDLKTGAVAGASFAYLGPSTVSDLQNAACVSVKELPPVYGSTSGAWWIYMNQNAEPFNNWSVRAAIAHAIDYTKIINVAFGGNAVQWVGPVPPSYPYYNPANLPNYSYDLALARQYMNSSPWPLPNGYPTPIKYAYINLGDWFDVATLLQANLKQIGINLVLVPITLDNLFQEQAIDPTTGQCGTATTANGGPFIMGQEFYTSDYIAPDDWTQNNAVSGGSANACMSQYANSDVDNWSYEAAAASDPATLTQLYTNITAAMYYNYTDIWLMSPTSFAVASSLLQGVVSNPMGSGLPFTMMFNTEYATNPS